MSKALKAVIALVLAGIAIGVIAAMAMSLGNDGNIRPTQQDQAQAARAWADMDSASREIACIVYSASDEEGDLFQDTGLGQAKMDLMASVCTHD